MLRGRASQYDRLDPHEDADARASAATRLRASCSLPHDVRKVLIANRGAIACRVIRTLKRMGIASVAVYSEADAQSLHVAQADEAVCIGPAPAAESYLRGERILEAARATGAQAIHPGLRLPVARTPSSPRPARRPASSSSVRRPSRCAPSASSTRRASWPQPTACRCCRARGLLGDAGARARRGRAHRLSGHAQEHGGRRRHRHAAVLERGRARARRFASVAAAGARQLQGRAASSSRSTWSTRGTSRCRSSATAAATCVALGERDCSVQRRNQKVIEETPAPGLARCHARAVARHRRAAGARRWATGRPARWSSSTTRRRGEFYFLEVNTRLQVEHGVTEEVTGIDLVEWMVRLAAGDAAARWTVCVARRAAHRSRCGSTPRTRPRTSSPAAALLTDVQFPADVRVDTWVERGSEVPPYYDPMLAKIIVQGRQPRAGACAKLQRRAGRHARRRASRPISSTCGRSWRDPCSSQGRADDALPRAASHYRPRTVDVLEPGVQTTRAGLAGPRSATGTSACRRPGRWIALAFRLANRLLGNRRGRGRRWSARLPGRRCASTATRVIASAGAPHAGRRWTARRSPCGARIAVQRRQRAAARPGAGRRAAHLPRRAGRVRRARLSRQPRPPSRSAASAATPGARCARATCCTLPDGAAASRAGARCPRRSSRTTRRDWEIGVLYGPHGAPDFFTPKRHRRPSSPPTGRCTTTPAAPACA